MEPVYAVLFSWAVTLSGYPNAPAPIVELKPHQFFVDKACGGNKNCRVTGWYPKSGGNIVYVDENLDIENSQIAASIIVHEDVHYLQILNKKPTTTCKDSVALEYEAYGVQKEYLLRNGVLANGIGPTVGPAVVSMNCMDER